MTTFVINFKSKFTITITEQPFCCCFVILNDISGSFLFLMAIIIIRIIKLEICTSSMNSALDFHVIFLCACVCVIRYKHYKQSVFVLCCYNTIQCDIFVCQMSIDYIDNNDNDVFINCHFCSFVKFANKQKNRQKRTKMN